MAIKLITSPSLEPVLLDEVKAHLRIDGDVDDALLTSLITVARREAEKITRRSIMMQTWELVLDSWPSCEISIPLPPLQSIVSIKYIDPDGVEQTLSPLLYQVDADSEPARIASSYGHSQTWPATRSQLSAVRIRFTAGYGTTPDKVPTEIKQWMLIRIGSLYENREADVNGFVDGLLDEYRVVTF